MLSDADRIVWQNPLFPQAHRPDIQHLTANISIGPFAEHEREMHPEMDPIILGLLDSSLQEHRVDTSLMKVFWYDSVHRSIAMSERAVVYSPEPFLKRFVYNAAASDTIGASRLIDSGAYTNAQREAVRLLIAQGFPQDLHIDSERTKIEKLGFRERLLVDEFVVSDLYGNDPRVMYATEVYTTAVELITDQLMRRTGNFRTFTNDISNGRVRLSHQHPESNIHFSKALFQAMKVIDWREILNAYLTRDIKATSLHLQQSADDPEAGKRIFEDLYRAMIMDEGNIYESIPVNKLSVVVYTRDNPKRD